MNDTERITSINELGKKYKIPKSLLTHAIAHGHDVETTEKNCKMFSDTGYASCCNGCCWGEKKVVVTEKPKKKRQVKPILAQSESAYKK